MGFGSRWIRVGCGRGGAARRRAPGAFTLVEILVAVALIGVLLAILLPSLGHTMRAARGFRCEMSLRSVAFDFSVFADDELHGDRGDDPAVVGSRRFRLETFQESQYGVDEFWRWGEASSHTLPDPSGNDPMRCSEIREPVTLLKSTPCGGGAIGPPRSVSYGFNLRLHVAEVEHNGQTLAQPVALSAQIMEEGMVPLAWDVDGGVAHEKGQLPVFSAPTLGDSVVFPDDQFWFPSMRHNGAANFAFIDGHVAASARPLEEAGWMWAYQPVK